MLLRSYSENRNKKFQIQGPHPPVSDPEPTIFKQRKQAHMILYKNETWQIEKKNKILLLNNILFLIKFFTSEIYIVR